MKKCPFCAEEIQDEAIKCRYCGEILGGPKYSKKGNMSSAPMSVIDKYKEIGKKFLLIGFIVMLISIGGCVAVFSMLGDNGGGAYLCGLILFLIGFFIVVVGRFFE